MDHDNHGELSMKRQRGRGRRPGGGHQHSQHQHQNPNRSLESSGPEGGKVRGPAALIYERYLQMARDASSSGDRVLGENFLQHADHYFRMVRAMQPATPPPQQSNDRFSDGDDGEEDSGAEMEAGEGGEMVADAGDQPDVEFPQGQQQQQQFDRDGDPRRRRGRRNRYRPNEGEGGGEPREAQEGGEREGAEAGEGRAEPPREERRERRERQPREQREEAGPEGFSSGPKPAFLRGD
jgi:hypothetical protein